MDADAMVTARVAAGVLVAGSIAMGACEFLCANLWIDALSFASRRLAAHVADRAMQNSNRARALWPEAASATHKGSVGLQAQ